MELADAVAFIRALKLSEPNADKATVQAAFVKRFEPQRKRSVFVGHGYSIRFSEVTSPSFTGTVTSLSTLKRVDHEPMVVCIVRPNRVDFMLANATFLRKVSHSSQQLSATNVKGSFNGTDILVEYQGVRNHPDNFERLFAMHEAFEWSENLERLVEATNAIVGRDNRFRPTDVQRQIVLAAPDRAAAALRSARFSEVDVELRRIVELRQAEILGAATIDNGKIRGDALERIITGAVTSHDLGDLSRDLGPGDRLVVDVKTTLLNRASAPKAYNVDKMLEFHATSGSVFAFFMLGVDVDGGRVVARLVPVLDVVLVEATGVQHHWAGRVSRGVTQLSGRFERVLEAGYAPTVDVAAARAFIVKLLDG